MATPKKRVGGETISPDETYPGTKVLKLMDISFANGRAAGIRAVELRNETQLRKSWEDGYEEGKRAAEAQHEELTTALNTLRRYLQREDD